MREQEHASIGYRASVAMVAFILDFILSLVTAWRLSLCGKFRGLANIRILQECHLLTLKLVTTSQRQCFQHIFTLSRHY